MTNAIVPHRCPKCSGKGWLQYNPLMPFGATTDAGPWRCDACTNGVVYAAPSESEPERAGGLTLWPDVVKY